MLFAASSRDLAAGWKSAAARGAPGGRVWIARRKLAARGAKAGPGDLTQAQVRAHGLQRGWVDFTICAIDATCSGLCSSERRESKT